MSIKLFFRFTAPMWAVFSLNQILFIFFIDYFSYHLPWIDTPLHLAGGFAASWTAGMFLDWLQKEKQALVRPEWLKFALLVGFTCFAAIVWEVGEFYHDWFFRDYAFQIGALDTVADLGNGLTGAILFCLVLYFKKK